MKTKKTLITKIENGVCTVSLNRTDVRNAFNEELIQDLQATFDEVATDAAIRAIVLRGEGPTFCAGGDLNWMQKSIELSLEENKTDTRKLAHMFHTLNTCPKPVVGLVHGAAIGGGVGLVSICDYVIATRETVFSLSEVRLGIIPACIGPFVLAKIGETHSRAMFVSAERFKADRAKEIGLIHEVVSSEADLQVSCKRILDNLLAGGPGAIRAAKLLIRELKSKNSTAEALEYVACILAELRISPEGQEGVKAFLEKRKPNWIKT